ncbi:hypothetical protein PENDEC_c004G04783 [Penicillium decumbens]|uniref:Thioredoxin domain-containing protein n=1 Tax=Penicillium decumbens TaxID=69771 RepID=A0A1V6PHX9_PENDC|nr:hypothetical protein PENDEC_c004G04783 [Penicillium decumbens]
MQAFKSPTFRLAFSRLARATPLLVRSPVTSRLPSIHAPRAFSSTPIPHFSHSTFKMAGGNVVEITTKEDFKSKVTDSQEPILVDFFAEWCGPCKAISPAVEKLSEQHTGIKFYKVDVDKLGEVAAENEISAMPTFLFFKDGKKIEMVRGANPPAINAAVQKLLA